MLLKSKNRRESSKDMEMHFHAYIFIFSVWSKEKESFCHMYIFNGVELRFHRGIEPHTKTVCALLKYTELKECTPKSFAHMS